MFIVTNLWSHYGVWWTFLALHYSFLSVSRCCREGEDVIMVVFIIISEVITVNVQMVMGSYEVTGLIGMWKTGEEISCRP